MVYKELPLNIDKFYACANLLVNRHIPYEWGGKVEHLIDNPPVLPMGGIDCSGFMRWLVYHATGNQIDIGDGSYTQGDFLRSWGLKPTAPLNCSYKDDHLRICVHHPDGLDNTGHIWAVRNGVTTESYGGHGPGHRAYNHVLSSGHSLVDLATICLVAV